MRSPIALRSLQETFRTRLSLRTQVLLVFVLCLGLVGIVMVFVNAYVIARRKDDMQAQAVLLADELGRRVSGEIDALLEEQGAGSLSDLKLHPGLSRQVNLVLRGGDKTISVSLLDSNNQVVFSSSADMPDIQTVVREPDDTQVRLDTQGMPIDEIVLQRKYPDTRWHEFDVVKGGVRLGSLHFLISESALYRDIEATSSEITRLLWGVLLAFVGVLALGLYLMARLFQHHVALIAENQRLDRMAYLGTLASGLAHEIRNPLNAMSVNLSVAEEELSAGEGPPSTLLDEALQMIRREVGRLNRSVTSFMAFAHPAANRRERIDLRKVVGEALDLLRPQIEESGTRVEVELPGEAELEADFSGLRQVVYNIVLNAIQAMAGDSRPAPVERRLVIGGRRESAQWRLWIEDTGPGVPPGEEEKMFEAFHTTKAAGTGLGLPIARAIIEANGGDIVARARPSGGLRIELTLPETGGRPLLFSPVLMTAIAAAVMVDNPSVGASADLRHRGVLRTPTGPVIMDIDRPIG